LSISLRHAPATPFSDFLSKLEINLWAIKARSSSGNANASVASFDKYAVISLFSSATKNCQDAPHFQTTHSDVASPFFGQWLSDRNGGGILKLGAKYTNRHHLTKNRKNQRI